MTVCQYRSNYTVYQSGGDARARYCVHGASHLATEGNRVVADQRMDVQVQDSWQILQPEYYKCAHSAPWTTDDKKEAFYTHLEREYDHCPKHDVKIVIRYLNAQIGQEEIYSEPSLI